MQSVNTDNNINNDSFLFSAFDDEHDALVGGAGFVNGISPHATTSSASSISPLSALSNKSSVESPGNDFGSDDQNAMFMMMKQRNQPLYLGADITAFTKHQQPTLISNNKSFFNSSYSSLASSPVLSHAAPPSAASFTVPNSPTFPRLSGTSSLQSTPSLLQLKQLSLQHAAHSTAASSVVSSAMHSPLLSSSSSSFQSHINQPATTVPNTTLLEHGIDTTQMTEDQLRNLATQMQSISSSTAAEIRRQLHIHSEQKRRLQIKGGFDELRAEIPGLGDQKKMSKAQILARAVEYVMRLKSEREIMIGEIERLREENRKLMEYCELK